MNNILHSFFFCGYIKKCYGRLANKAGGRYRSDALHTAYRALKSQVQAAETVADVATIVWPED